MSDKQNFQQISHGMLVGSSGIVCSRISGLVRDIVFARFWGTGSALSIFLLAFTIPNMFRRLFGEGALTEAFVPVFNDKLSRGGKASAFLLLSQILSLVTLFLLAVCGIGMAVVVLGQNWLPAGQIRLMASLLPILFPYLVFICLAGFLAGVLNSFGHFAVPAYTPILMNLALIVTSVWICPHLADAPVAQAQGLAWAVLISGLLQLIALIPMLRRLGFRFEFRPDTRSADVREVIRLLIPGFIGAGVYQVNLLCDRVMASWLGPDAVTSLYYSERLVYLPIGVFAVALGAACLPAMSRAFADNRQDEMQGALLYSLRHILFFALPCVLGLMLLGGRIIALMFQRGEFDQSSYEATLGALLFYTPGIPAFAALKILRSGFYSRKDTRTPVWISAFCMVLNVVLNLVLMGPLGQRGLALATTISACTNAVVLLVLLYRRLHPDRDAVKGFLKAIGKLLAAVALSGLSMFVLRVELPIESVLIRRFLELLIPAAAGVFVYFTSCRLMKMAELSELMQVVRRRRGRLGKMDS